MKQCLTSIERLFEGAWLRVRDATDMSDAALVYFRVIFGLFMLLFYMPAIAWVGDVPPGFFFPPIISIAYLFNDFPPGWLFQLHDLLMPVLALGVMLGVRARWCGLAMGVMGMMLATFEYCFGKIDHMILIWAAILCLSLTNWGSMMAVMPDKPLRLNGKDSNPSLAILGICIAFGFFTAGVEKAQNWIDFDLQTSGILKWLYPGYFELDRDIMLAPYMFDLPRPVIEAMDYTAVIFEVSALFMLLSSRRAWRIWLFVACVFHWINVATLSITFQVHTIIYGVYLMPWLTSTAVPSSDVKTWPTWVRASFIAGGLLMMGHLYQRITGYGGEILYMADYELELYFRAYFTAAMWTVTAGFALWRVVKGDDRRSALNASRS